MKRAMTCLVIAFASLPVWADPTVEIKPQTVPFVIVPSGHFLVKVKLNGSGPYNLIFDTGAPTTLISPRIAGEAKLLDKVKDKPPIAIFGMMGQASIKKFQVGDVVAEDVSAMIIDHPTVKMFSEEYGKKYGSVDGLVGFPFFARYAMTVDYAAKEMTFTPNGYQPEDVMQSMQKTMMAAMSGGKKKEPKVASAKAYWGFDVSGSGDGDAGVNVIKIVAGSPMADAGLKVGDRILTIGGRWTDSISDTHAAAGYFSAGKPVEVVVVREGKEVRLKVTPKSGY